MEALLAMINCLMARRGFEQQLLTRPDWLQGNCVSHYRDTQTDPASERPSVSLCLSRTVLKKPTGVRGPPYTYRNSPYSWVSLPLKRYHFVKTKPDQTASSGSDKTTIRVTKVSLNLKSIYEKKCVNYVTATLINSTLAMTGGLNIITLYRMEG